MAIGRDCRALQDGIARGDGSLRGPLAFAGEFGGRAPRHRDHAMALRSALGVFLGIVACVAVWIATAWPDGATAAMMGAVLCCLFATQDDPAPAILSFATWTGIAAVAIGGLLFGVMPLVHDFVSLALVLAPALILCGLLMTSPRTLPVGLALGVNGNALLAIQDRYTSEFGAYVNSGIALVGGIWLAALVTRLVRSVGAEHGARRLVAASRTDLARAARRRGRGDRTAFAHLMLDRLGLLVPRLAAAGPDSDLARIDTLAALRIGMNLVALRRARHGLAPGRSPPSTTPSMRWRPITRGPAARPPTCCATASTRRWPGSRRIPRTMTPGATRSSASWACAGHCFPKRRPPAASCSRGRPPDGRYRPLRRLRAGPAALGARRRPDQPRPAPSDRGAGALPAGLAPAALRPLPHPRVPRRRRVARRPPDLKNRDMTRALAFLGRFAVTAAMLALAIVVGTALWDYTSKPPGPATGGCGRRSSASPRTSRGSCATSRCATTSGSSAATCCSASIRTASPWRSGQAEAVVAGRKANLVQAEADLARYRQLSDNVVSQQKLEATLAAEQSARAVYDQAVADRDLAKLNLARSEVRASVNGRISNLDLRPGAYVGIGKAVMALVDGDTLHVQGYFEETKLDRIHPGDPVTVRLMGEDHDVTGTVESIAAGIEDRERSAGSSLLANVNPTFAWVRLAQRVPVRIALDPAIDRDRLTVGRTATVVVHPGGERPAVRPFEGLRHLGLRDGWEALKARLPATRG